MDNSFDLAIGKIPFGSTKMLDPDIPQSKRWMLSTLPNCDTPSVLTVVHKTDSPPDGLTIPLFLWCIVMGISRNQIFLEKVAIGAKKVLLNTIISEGINQAFSDLETASERIEKHP